MKKGDAQSMLIGLAVGDALGVPYEFSSREKMKINPAKDMVGYGTHQQPAGTWSDDSSLTFCLVEAMNEGYSLEGVAKRFVNWKNYAYWTARDNVFDIGLTTSRAISRLEELIENDRFDETSKSTQLNIEDENGNGSLMRILPLLFHIKGKDLTIQFKEIHKNSALTHRHIRAAMSCMIYITFAEYILNGVSLENAYLSMRNDIKDLWELIHFDSKEQKHFKRIIQDDIRLADENTILSGGYVIESLEVAFWSLLNTSSYEEAVLKGVNFGHDTDTTGAIIGGIAGLYYGLANIPVFWQASIAKMDEILDLGKKLEEKYI